MEYLRLSYQVGSWDGTDHATGFAIPTAAIGTWVPIAGVYDGSTWRLYGNGTEVSATASDTGAVFVYGDWAIGSRGDGTERFFLGSVDQVRICARALSAGEIRQLHDSP